MKYSEYDSPIGITLSSITDQLSRTVAERVDNGIYTAIVNAGFTVDRDTLIRALQGDSKRYREAYKRGYETGYEKAREELYSDHQVAEILAELFGDKCVCDIIGTSDWLPDCCEVLSEGPEPAGVSCWEQYLKHRKTRDDDDDDEEN